jgi:hypothetical protein
MTLRLHRVTDEQWVRLAAFRRSRDLSGPPPRASITAIESELQTLGGEPIAAAVDEYPKAAAG